MSAIRLLSGGLLAATVACAGGSFAEQSAWTSGIDDNVSWETVHTLSQLSDDRIPDEYASKEVQPVLSFRCTEGGDGTLSMQIDWQRFISSFKTEAGFKVDDGERRWIELEVDESNRVTLLRNPTRVEELTAQLSDGNLLDVEIAPYSEAPVSVRFSLARFEPMLAELEGRCGA